MYCVKKMTDDLYWVGGSDRRLALFENVYPIPNGVSYNAYLLLDEKTVLLDTVDRSIADLFFENVAHVLNGRKLDYVIVNHMEPDHCAVLQDLVLRYPEVKIVCNAKTVTMIRNFFTFDIDSRAVIVKEMDTLCTGRHTFAFVMAPMVHWPEAMVSYDATTKTLFSADAFGTFGALNGNLYADEVNFKTEYLADARRYYTNIVGKYGTQVQALLKKAAAIEIETICPLHGPVWRKDIAWFLDKYVHWATYQPEETAVVIAYASVYGNTENAANILAGMLADKGVRNVKVYDVSATHPSYIVSECFRASHLVFLSTTYNAGMFVNMENLVHDIVHHNLQNRTIAMVENGSWAPTAAGLMRAEFQKLKNCTILDEGVSIRSSLKEDQLAQMEALADALVASMPAQKPVPAQEKPAGLVEQNAMFSLSYGLFVLTARDGAKDNGCIINTVTQLTDSPKRISIAVNKANLTHDMIVKTGEFNVSVLSNDAPFALFQHYGFQSGRNTDKFAGVQGMARSTNGIYYIPYCTSAFLSAKVTQTVEFETHTLFIADVTEAKLLSNVPSMTYAYYFANVKPKPAVLQKQTGWVCKICGWVYEGEELPPDIVCPLCKHGAADFERLQ
ncbi:MAG: MBL fold metallo-hydrolase [Oscillospiraceae bacterium]|jgi:flavorubredoxin/flavin reductase (DIM6/NTAB) family NADH-FMN oxidoreductase RutF/rubredoxin|nr:MBL fold metallo-hydrolase [Oscillospiraceae bacterium]